MVYAANTQRVTSRIKARWAASVKSFRLHGTVWFDPCGDGLSGPKFWDNPRSRRELPAPDHHHINTSYDFQSYRFNVPMFCVDMLLFRGLWQTEIYHPDMESKSSHLGCWYHIVKVIYLFCFLLIFLFILYYCVQWTKDELCFV